MRAFIVLIILVIVVGIATGVIYFNRQDDRLNITIDTEKARQKRDEMVEDGKRALHDAGKAVERTGEEMQEANDPARRETTPRRAP